MPQLHVYAPRSSSDEGSSRDRIRSTAEDWAGITDPAERRRLQNLLNQRAQPQEAKNNRHNALILPKTTRGQVLQQYPQPSTLPEAVIMMAHFDRAAYQRYFTGNACLDHLMTLSKFFENLRVLELVIEDMDDDAASPFLSIPGSMDISYPCERYYNLPTALSPTSTQRNTPHHPWLDCFPFPQIRDNLIGVGEEFDDCQLCNDLMDPASKDFGMMVWGDPWMPGNWEVSEFFFAKWSWVIRGCPEIIVSSNRWRAKRGMGRLRSPASMMGSTSLTQDSQTQATT
ncbi:DUF3425 domain-containing protein [Aspergillus stella-maris]|uniref:DUF3425 domain-containing protein n=1 Tax=Aspergillus stella-maris TaxID=1810926 RepID=UPI003CCD1BE0